MTEASEAHAQSGETPNPSEPEPQHAGQDAGAAPQSDDAPAALEGGENSAASAASAPEAATPAESEPAESEGEAQADARTDADADADPAEAASTEAGEAEAAPGAEGGAKRKRRRRKKGKGKSEAGEQDAANAGGEHAESRRKRESPVAPLQRFFAGAQAGRKHGFAVDEAVAGRVTSVAGGTVTIDLFGKALAFADEHEPREVPVREPAPVVAEAASPETETEAAPSQESGGEALVAAPTETGEAADIAASASEAATEAATEATVTPADEPASGEDSAPRVAQAESEQQAAADASGEQPARVEDAAAASAEQADADQPGADQPGADQAGAEHEHAASDDAGGEDADGEMDGESTLSGEASPGGHGPLPPAPVVPEHLPRLDPPKVGQVFRGRVGAISESGHIAIVNRYIDRKAVLANLERYRAQRRRVQGLVYGFNRGGFDVLVEGARAFCPASTMALEDIEDPTQYLGQKLEFLLPASQAVSKDIIVSRRSILERQQRKKARELVRSLEPGQKLKGRVTQVREFGLFVDIGGIEGLVHQSELSFAHGVKPGDVAQAGDEVEVQVLRVGAEPTRRESGKRDRVARVSLSMKALQPDPWDAHADVLKEGSAQLGKITRTTDFGAFVEVAPQIEGLLHITELGRDLKHANQAVSEGDELQVVIERVDRSARRISLSKLSQQELEELQSGALGGDEGPRSIRPGSRIKVKVARVEARGLVVRISGVLGKRARGYIPSIELPGGRGGDLRKSYPLGMELEVKIVGVDRDGGLRCSPKALAVDEERKAVKDYRREASKQGFGTFGDLLRAKLGQGDTKQ